MRLFGFNLRITRTEAGPPPAQKSLTASALDWLRGQEPPPGTVLANAYEQVVWVYRAINVLAEQVANVPFLFSAGERGRERLITSGPLLDFYARPHPQINRFQYWELRIIWLMLRGECFRVPIFADTLSQSPNHNRNRNPNPNRPLSLKRVLILDPAKFQHIVQDHQLIGWRYTGFGPRAPLASQVFLPEEVWFEKLPNPFDFWRGLAPLSVAGLAARTDFAAGAFMRGIIENNADTGLIVRTDQWLSDEQREQIVAALRERKRMAGQADRPVLLLGSAEVIRPQLSSSDLQFLENRKFSRAEICAAFGVPEEIVTTTDYAKYDVMAGSRLNFIENRIAPLCSRLEAEEDAAVKCLDPQASGWFDLDSLPIMQEARRNRLAAARTGFEMGVPFNDLNRVLDLGFKPLPWGDTGYVAGKLQEVGARAAGERGGAKREEGRDAAGENLPARAESLFATIDRPRTDSLMTPPPVATPCSTGPTNLQKIRLVNKVRRFFFEQRGRVLAALEAAAKASASGSPAGGGGAGEEFLLVLDDAFDLSFENRALQSALGAAPCSQPGGNPGLLPDAINQITRDSLRTVVREGIAAGDPRETLAARVKAVFNQAAQRRAGEIAAAFFAAAATPQPQAPSAPSAAPQPIPTHESSTV